MRCEFLLAQTKVVSLDTHKTVLLKEAVDALEIESNGIYVDGTFGRGGHSREMLSRLGEQGRVIALDLETGEFLWHLQPDTFPHCPYPVAFGDKVVLSSGAKRELKRLTPDDRSP